MFTLSTKKWSQLLITCALTLAAHATYAQNTTLAKEGSGHSGGGSVTESDLRSYMAKIDLYLQTDEGKLVFPEIVQYDKIHGSQAFHELLLATRPSVKAGKLYDANGEERDCMSYANSGNRYFICNSNALPEKTLDNQPSFYRIVLHELLVQAGIEKPISKAVPSDYAVSYRITENVHLETYQEWVPGAAHGNKGSLAASGIYCVSTKEDSKLNERHFFLLYPNGDFLLINQTVPDSQFEYGYQSALQQQVGGNTSFEIRKALLKVKTASLFASEVKNTVVFRGNSKELFSGNRYLDSSDTSVSLTAGTSLYLRTFARLDRIPTHLDHDATVIPLSLSYRDATSKKYKYQTNLEFTCSWNAGNTAHPLPPIEEMLKAPHQKVFKSNPILDQVQELQDRLR